MCVWHCRNGWVAPGPATPRRLPKGVEVLAVAVRAPGRNRSSQPGGLGGRQTLTILHISGVEVHRKRSRGFK